MKNYSWSLKNTMHAYITLSKATSYSKTIDIAKHEKLLVEPEECKCQLASGGGGMSGFSRNPKAINQKRIKCGLSMLIIFIKNY